MGENSKKKTSSEDNYKEPEFEKDDSKSFKKLYDDKLEVDLLSMATWSQRAKALLVDYIIISVFSVLIVSCMMLIPSFSNGYNEFVNTVEEANSKITNSKQDNNTETNKDHKVDISEELSTLTRLGLVYIAINLVSVFLAMTLYFPLTMRRKASKNGQSFGKQIFKIKVVKQDLSEIGVLFSFYRQIVVIGLLFWGAGALLLGIPTLINYWWPLKDKNNRALHDKMVKTRVLDMREKSSKK